MSLRDPALIGITQARTPERTADSLRRVAVLERRPPGAGGGTPSGTISGHLGGSTWPALNIATTATPRVAGLGVGITGPASGVSVNGTAGTQVLTSYYDGGSLKAQVGKSSGNDLMLYVQSANNLLNIFHGGNWDASSQNFVETRITCNPTAFVSGGIGDRGGASPGSPASDWITEDAANSGDQTAVAITSTTGVGVSPIVVTTSTAHGFTSGARVFISGVTGNTAVNGQRTITNASGSTFEVAGVTANGTGSGGSVRADFTTWAAYTTGTTFDERGSFHAFLAGTITAGEIEGVYGQTNISIAKRTSGTLKWFVTHDLGTAFTRLTTGDSWQIYSTGVTGLDGNWIVTKISNSVFELDGSTGVTDPATGPYDCTARRSAYHEVTPFQGLVVNASLGALTKAAELPVFVDNSKQGRCSATEFITVEYNTYSSYNSDTIFGSGSVWKDYGSTIGVFTGQSESGFGEIGTGILVRAMGSANIRRPFVYQDAGVDLITMDRWGNLGIGNAARVNQTTHTTGLPSLLTIAPSSPAYSAAQGIQFGTVASVTTPINLYLGISALLCNGIFDAPTFRISGTGGEGYIRFLEQGTLPTTANANQCRLYAEVDGAGTKLSFIDDAGVRKTLSTTSATSTPEFLRVGLGQPANTYALSFLASTVATGGIAFGSDINLYRSAANDLTFAGTVSPRLIFQQASGATATDPNLGVYQDGDTQPRTRLTYDGKLWFGSGAATPDVELFRQSADILRTNDYFGINVPGSASQATAGHYFSVTGIYDINKTAGGTVLRYYTANTASPRFQIDNTSNANMVVLTWGTGTTQDTTLKRSAAGVLLAGESFHVTSDFRHLGSNLGFYGVTAAARPAAYTQTYATATRTHAARTAASVATTAATQVTPWGFSTQAQADAIVAAVNALIVDQQNTAQVLNQAIDDDQLQGLKQ